MNSFFTPIQPIKPLGSLKEKSDVTEKSESAKPFSDFLKDSISQYESLQRVADSDTAALALGDVDNLAQVEINSLKAQAALQTTVQLTSRIVNAYKEIMQMQV